MTDSSGNEEIQYPNPDNPEHERYGFMERELAFKLLAAHAMVDPDFFEYLRTEPAKAAAHLHIALEQADLDYLTNDVDWKTLTQLAEPVRSALVLENVTNSW